MIKIDNFDFYNSDNMEIMKQYPDKYFDLAIVDPPYGIGMDGDFSCFSKNDKGFLGNRNHKKKQWDNKIPSKEYFEELFRVSKNQIIFGANYFTDFLPPSMGWIVWDKKIANANNKNFSDCELAYTSYNKRLIKYAYDWIGFGYLNNKAKQEKIHPTEKPIDLYGFIIKDHCEIGFKGGDTQLGSGSIALAIDKANKLDNMNLEFVGIELDSEYFNDSLNRFKMSHAQQTIF